MEKVTLSDVLMRLAQEKKFKELREVMCVMNAYDLAVIFDDITAEKKPMLFRLLPKELAAEVFVELEDDVKEELISSFSDSELSAVLDEMYVDDAADLAEEMPANVVRRILSRVRPETRKMINEILRYPDDSAGSIMNTEYICLHESYTVEQAIAHIRKTGYDKETINTLYVTDNSRKLIGVVSIRNLLFAKDGDIIRDIMDSNSIVSVTTLDDKENVAHDFENYDLTELPVTDSEGRLVGIVTVDDAIDVLQEEATEDIEKMAAITPSDRPYLKTPAHVIYMRRIPWLLLLMVSATFTGIIIANFENALGALPILTAFIPMLMDTGGNSGSQSSVTVIRGLSLDSIRFSDIFRVLLKEFGVSVLCGLTLAAAVFGKVFLIDKLIMGKDITLLIAVVISLTMLATVIIAKLVGCSLPLIAKKIGFDPAVMASPFITTIVDAVSLLIYFGFATAILNI